MKFASLLLDCADRAAGSAGRHGSSGGFWSIAVAFLAVFVLTACDQHEVRYRVRWSPDGSKALVVASDGVHLSNADGVLSSVLMKDVYPLAWMPDSSRFAVCRHKEVRDWVTVQHYLSKPEQSSVIENAKKLRPILLAHSGDWEHWSEAEEAQLKAVDLTLSDAIMVYLRDHDDGALKKKLGDKVPEYLKGAVKIDVVEIQRLSDQTSQLEKVMYETSGVVKELRTSPNGAAIAVVEEKKNTGGDTYSTLTVLLANGDPKNVARDVARYPDWTADSRTVVYLQRASASPEVTAGKLCLRRVFDDQDKPLKELMERQDLASTVFNEYGRVRCLKDGRTIFSSAELMVPAAPDSQSQRPMLFSVDPRYFNLIKIIPDRLRYSMGAQGECFAVSPDGQHLAVLSESGLVHVLDIASGKITEAQSHALDPDTYGRAAFMPEWRNDDEITFAGPATKVEGSKRLSDVILYSLTRDKGASISDKWAPEASAFLDQPEKESTPTQEKQSAPKPQ